MAVAKELTDTTVMVNSLLEVQIVTTFATAIAKIY
jgi:hypothetical protein